MKVRLKTTDNVTVLLRDLDTYFFSGDYLVLTFSDSSSVRYSNNNIIWVEFLDD